MKEQREKLADFANSFRFFVINLEMASNYQNINMLTGNPQPPNYIIDEMLFPLLYIQLVSILDNGLDLIIEEKQLSLKRPFLSEKIKLLSENNLINERDALDQIRKRRNEIAHGSFAQMTMEELRSALLVIHSELVHRGLVEDIPIFDFFAERESVKPSEPDPSLAYMFEYSYGLRENGKNILTYSWLVKVTQEAIWV